MPVAAPASPAGAPHLLKAAKKQWRTVGRVLDGAAVYLDAGAAEAVAAGVGLPFLLGALLPSAGHSFLGPSVDWVGAPEAESRTRHAANNRPARLPRDLGDMINALLPFSATEVVTRYSLNTRNSRHVDWANSFFFKASDGPLVGS
jgi:hypothetical protein